MRNVQNSSLRKYRDSEQYHRNIGTSSFKSKGHFDPIIYHLDNLFDIADASRYYQLYADMLESYITNNAKVLREEALSDAVYLSSTLMRTLMEIGAEMDKTELFINKSIAV